MAWSYRFLTLSERQIEERRVLLDRNGFYGWLSPLILLALVYVVRLIKNTSTKELRFTEKPPNQPPTAFQIFLRRVSWVLNQPLTLEFGAVKVHLLGGAYTAWLLFLTFRQTGNDYMHLTKSFGHIAISQLPFQYMVAIKSPQSPAQMATGLSHETLNPYHRLSGRIIHLFLTTHAVMYMSFFIKADLLSKRIQDWDVRLGLAAFWTFNIIAIAAIPPIRKNAYHKGFYRFHAILPGVVLPILAFHNPYTKKYVVQMAVAFIFNIIARKKSTTASAVISSIVPVEGTNLLKVRVPGPAWGLPPLMGSGKAGWVAGQHVYLKQGMPPTSPRSPFTIVSLPPAEGHECSNVDLVVRNLNGPNTGWLAAKPKEAGSLERNAQLFIEGPYGESREYVPKLLALGQSAGIEVFIAGGVGATYTLPVYMSLLATRGTTENMHFVWVVRSQKEAQWGLDMLATQARVAEVNVRVIISPERDENAEKTSEEANGYTNGQAPQLKSGVKIDNIGKRPDLKQIIDGLFSSGPTGKPTANSQDYTKVNVLVCAPPGMSNSIRKHVGRHVMRYGRDVMYHEEAFGLGA